MVKHSGDMPAEESILPEGYDTQDMTNLPSMLRRERTMKYKIYIQLDVIAIVVRDMLFSYRV